MLPASNKTKNSSSGYVLAGDWFSLKDILPASEEMSSKK
jgi:hypothetical protein